jgi:glycosyltransferase involved in cell wall biosynthesis
MLVHSGAGTAAFVRAQSLARWLEPLGYEVTLIAARSAAGLGWRETSLKGGQFLEMPDLLPARLRNGGLSPIDLACRAQHVLRVRYDLVYASGPRPATVWPALIARRRWDSPYVAGCDDLWGWEGIAEIRRGASRLTLGRLDAAMERFVWSHADAIATPSTDLLRRMRQGGLPRERIQLVGVGADFERIQPLPKADMRRLHGVPAAAHVVVHAGSSDYDADLLSELFVALARLDPDAFLLMVGARLPSVERRLTEAQLQGRWKNVGFIPMEHLGKALACGDVALLPYSDRPLNRGRFPSRFGDYLASGRPMVINPTGDAGRIVHEERVGLTAPEGPTGFATVVHGLLSDPGLQEEMGRRARRLAETRYAWRAMAEQLDVLFRQVLARGRREAG